MILGVINSKLIEFFWSVMFSDFKSTFPQVTIFSLAQVPVNDGGRGSQVREFASGQRMVIGIVDQILAAKEMDAAANTGKLERDLDQHVYALYGLTPEEIAIVEGTATGRTQTA